VVANGVRDAPDVDVIATRNDREVAILVWHYHDDDVAAPDARIALTLSGLAGSICEVEQFQMDADRGNAYAGWRSMGSPRAPSGEQYAELERASQLARVGKPTRHDIGDGRLEIGFSLPRQGVSLFRLRSAA